MVMVVDDEIEISTLLSEALADGGYDVVVASNGAEAITHLNASCPDMVISDYMMPGLDGLELLKFLRAHEGCHDVPFILMSGLPPVGLPRHGSGYSSFIKKPFMLSTIVKLVSELLQPAA